MPTTENAACWLVATNNGKFAYTGNAGGSLSISGFRVGTDGSLALLTPGGKTGVTTAGVTDLALSANSHFLYGRLGDGIRRGVRGPARRWARPARRDGWPAGGQQPGSPLLEPAAAPVAGRPPPVLSRPAGSRDSGP